MHTTTGPAHQNAAFTAAQGTRPAQYVGTVDAGDRILDVYSTGEGPDLAVVQVSGPEDWQWEARLTSDCVPASWRRVPAFWRHAAALVAA